MAPVTVELVSAAVFAVELTLAIYSLFVSLEVPSPNGVGFYLALDQQRKQWALAFVAWGEQKVHESLVAYELW